MRILFIGLLAFLSGNALLAQENKFEKELESAVAEYKDLRTFIANISDGAMTAADYEHIKSKTASGLSKLKPIVEGGSRQEQTVANYFKANLQYEQAIAAGKRGLQAESISLFKEINTNINSFSSDLFPLEYYFDNRLHIIRWENFAPIQASFNHTMAAHYYKAGNLEEALPYARKAKNNPYIEQSQLSAADYIVADIKLSKNELDQEALNAAVDALDNYINIDSDDRDELMSKIPEGTATVIRKTLSAEASLSDEGRVPARVAKLYRYEKLNEPYLEFAAMAIRDGYDETRFAEQTAEDALAAGNNAVARLATDKMAESPAEADCGTLQTIANNYYNLGLAQEAERFKDKSEKCQVQTQKKERAANRDGGLYLGTYIVPLFRKNWGVVGAIQTKKVLFEASFLDISNRRDKLRDLQLRSINGADDERIYWDGYYGHIAISRIRGGRPGGRPYAGMLFGYNLREFEAFDAEVFDANEQSLGMSEFNPVEKRYILMMNGGLHGYGRFFASDFFIGLGGSFNTFDRGGLEGDNFSYSSPMLNSRKANRVSLMVRLGITIGLQVGPRTFKKK
jgi:hypothetical protein